MMMITSLRRARVKRRKERSAWGDVTNEGRVRRKKERVWVSGWRFRTSGPTAKDERES